MALRHNFAFGRIIPPKINIVTEIVLYKGKTKKVLLNMKKIISILAAASMMLLATSAFAQVHVGAGYINDTETTKLNKDADKSSENLNGVYAGVGYTIHISDAFAVTPGLYWSMIGKDDYSTVAGIALKGDFKEHALNVPIDFSYGFNLAPDAKFFVYAGPTIQYGISSKTTGSVGSISADVDNFENDNYSRFNVMLGGGVGAQVLDAIRITVGYDAGLTNLYKGSGDAIQKRNQLKIGVAYVF